MGVARSGVRRLWGALADAPGGHGTQALANQPTIHNAASSAYKWQPIPLALLQRSPPSSPLTQLPRPRASCLPPNAGWRSHPGSQRCHHQRLPACSEICGCRCAAASRVWTAALRVVVSGVAAKQLRAMFRPSFCHGLCPLLDERQWCVWLAGFKVAASSVFAVSRVL